MLAPFKSTCTPLSLPVVHYQFRGHCKVITSIPPKQSSARLRIAEKPEIAEGVSRVSVPALHRLHTTLIVFVRMPIGYGVGNGLHSRKKSKGKLIRMFLGSIMSPYTAKMLFLSTQENATRVTRGFGERMQGDHKPQLNYAWFLCLPWH